MPHRRSGARASVMSSWAFIGPSSTTGGKPLAPGRPEHQLWSRRRGIVGRAGTRRRIFARRRDLAQPRMTTAAAVISTPRLRSSGSFARRQVGADLTNTGARDAVEHDAEVGCSNPGICPRYAGDVWFAQPEKADHSWRTIRWNGMTSMARPPAPNI